MDLCDAVAEQHVRSFWLVQGGSNGRRGVCGHPQVPHCPCPPKEWITVVKNNYTNSSTNPLLFPIATCQTRPRAAAYRSCRINKNPSHTFGRAVAFVRSPAVTPQMDSATRRRLRFTFGSPQDVRRLGIPLIPKPVEIVDNSDDETAAIRQDDRRHEGTDEIEDDHGPSAEDEDNEHQNPNLAGNLVPVNAAAIPAMVAISLYVVDGPGQPASAQ